VPIAIGATVPPATLYRLGSTGRPEPVRSDDLFAGRTVILISVPGAFTPTCSSIHLPQLIENAGAIHEKGADEIVCIAVNDPWVMKTWADALGADSKVTLLSDGNGELTEALGLSSDGSPVGLGTRGKRAMLRIDDKVVKAIEIEEKSGVVELTGAQSCLAAL